MMNPHMKSQILPRVRSDALKQTVNGCFGIGELVHETRTKLAADPNLSDDGRRTKLSDYVKNDYTKRFVDITRAHRKAGESLTARQGNIKLVIADRSETAERQRAEVRTMLRAIPTADARSAKAFQLAETDPLAAEAILDRSSMVDLPPERIEAIRKQHLERHQGPALGALKQDSDEVGAVGGAVDAAYKDLQVASGMPPHVFDELMTQLIQRAG